MKENLQQFVTGTVAIFFVLNKILILIGGVKTKFLF